MTTGTYDPVVLDYRRISGGDWHVVISVQPGRRITVQVPAASFDAGHLGELAARVVSTLTAPHGATITQHQGAP